MVLKSRILAQDAQFPAISGAFPKFTRPDVYSPALALSDPLIAANGALLGNIPKHLIKSKNSYEAVFRLFQQHQSRTALHEPRHLSGVGTVTVVSENAAHFRTS